MRVFTTRAFETTNAKPASCAKKWVHGSPPKSSRRRSIPGCRNSKQMQQPTATRPFRASFIEKVYVTEKFRLILLGRCLNEKKEPADYGSSAVRSTTHSVL